MDGHRYVDYKLFLKPCSVEFECPVCDSPQGVDIDDWRVSFHDDYGMFEGYGGEITCPDCETTFRMGESDIV